MAKTLYLIRHAKSDWSQGGQRDFDRTLNSRGLSDAPMMGKILKELHVVPEKIISSPAERAKIAAEFMAEQIGYDIDKIDYNEEIYESSPRTLLAIVNGLDDKFSSVVIFGHNPTFTHLAEYLTKADIGNIPTAGAVKIRFDIESWQMASEGSGELLWFEYPKKYYSGD